MLFDGIFLTAMVITGIFCAIKESQIPWYNYDFVFRRGAYSIAAVRIKIIQGEQKTFQVFKKSLLIQ